MRKVVSPFEYLRREPQTTESVTMLESFRPNDNALIAVFLNDSLLTRNRISYQTSKKILYSANHHFTHANQTKLKSQIHSGNIVLSNILFRNNLYFLFT